MSGNSSRKPSGSSTHSGAHSPSGSPGTAQSHRKLNPNAAGNMYGVGMGASNGLKPLSSGWQVWGTSPSSKRNASVSSATSVNELSSSGDTSFRGHMGDWSASRPTSGTWDDIADIPQKKDFPQMDPHSSMPLHTRQRQSTVTQAPTFPAPRIDDRSAGSKNGQFSPQRYENPLGKDSNGSRYAPAASPTRPFGTAYPGQPNVIQNSSFDNLQQPPSATDELSLALRGMAVEDDYSARQQVAGSHPSGPHPHNRVQPMPQPRPYNSYPQGEYNPYYSIPPGRESYGEYPYGYEAYRGPTDPSLYASSNMNPSSPANLYPGVSPGLHPNAVAEMHRQQPGLFFDFNAAARPPASQFYYPAHQGVMYPPTHSPMVTPQLGRANPISIADKKREMQYNIQQQLSPQNVMYGSMRSTPSPHPQPFGGAVDYGSPISVMMPGGPMFPQPMHVYARGLRQGRRNDWSEPTALRSALLDEFRANKARKWELRDIFGYIVEFSGDQHGSRFIQQKLENATSEEKQIVFDEIVPDNTLQLIQDVFGNYVIQKLFEHGTQVQKTLLANTMEGHVLPLSLQMYGCRVVQKAVEYILPDQQGTFVKELDAHVLKCVKDANGNHVIQKLIERVSPDRLGFVTSFRGNVYDLSTHPYGCRVLQRCLEHLPDEHTRPLLEELHKYTVNLMQDQFGNYVVQFVLENGKPQDKAVIISKLRGQMLQMARHKFASNVCEKALVCADLETRRVLIDEMMTPKHDGVSPIVTMMKDQYANYVLQRALAVVEGDQKEALIGRVKPQLANMRRYSSAYSKHLVSIERLLEKYTGAAQSEPGLDLPSPRPETP